MDWLDLVIAIYTCKKPGVTNIHWSYIKQYHKRYIYKILEIGALLCGRLNEAVKVVSACCGLIRIPAIGIDHLESLNTEKK